ncbi:hypothetical protein HK096_011096, partial [Nowakowskiella sp. JEL0078]
MEQSEKTNYAGSSSHDISQLPEVLVSMEPNNDDTVSSNFSAIIESSEASYPTTSTEPNLSSLLKPEDPIKRKNRVTLSLPPENRTIPHQPTNEQIVGQATTSTSSATLLEVNDITPKRRLTMRVTVQYGETNQEQIITDSDTGTTIISRPLTHNRNSFLNQTHSVPSTTTNPPLRPTSASHDLISEPEAAALEALLDEDVPDPELNRPDQPSWVESLRRRTRKLTSTSNTTLEDFGSAIQLDTLPRKASAKSNVSTGDEFVGNGVGRRNTLPANPYFVSPAFRSVPEWLPVKTVTFAWACLVLCLLVVILNVLLAFIYPTTVSPVPLGASVGDVSVAAVSGDSWLVVRVIRRALF